MRVHVVFVHPDGTPDEETLEGPRVTYKMWQSVGGGLTSIARIVVYRRVSRGRWKPRRSVTYAAVTRIERVMK